MYLDPFLTKSQSHSQVEPLQSLEDVKRNLSSPEKNPGRPFLGRSGFQDIQFSNRILPPHVSSDSEDAKYKDTFSWWNQKKPGEYATALYELKTQRGEEFRDGFLRYVTRKGHARRPDYQKLEMGEFIDMLEYADFLERNRASSIINGRLWMGKFYSFPQFCLQLGLRGLYFLTLNGRAVHPPEADTATCESYDVTSVFPNLYAGVRYKTASSDTLFRTLCFVTLGNVMTTECEPLLTTTVLNDTGFTLVANMSRIHKDSEDTVGSTELYLIHNITDEDATDGKSLNSSNEKRSASVLKIEGSPRHVLVERGLETGKTPSSGFPVTPMSYDEPEIVQLGMSLSSHGHYEPIPLFLSSSS